MHLSILLLRCALFVEFALGCVREPDEVRKEIDWSEMHGTWYYVASIPNSIGPLCWNIEELRPTKNGVQVISYEHEYWHHEDTKPTYIEFVHEGGGFYSERSVNVTQFNEGMESSLTDWDAKEKAEILQKEDDVEFKHKSFFLTDYNKYFIVIYCLEPGFLAFAMSPTPSITMEFIEDITEALNGVGLKSPTMTLKPGCMINRH